MRTKYEALKTPMTGDLYLKRYGIVRKLKRVRLMKGENVIHTRIRECPSCTTEEYSESWTLPHFRRWAANAKYLGGTNDN